MLYTLPRFLNLWATNLRPKGRLWKPGAGVTVFVTPVLSNKTNARHPATSVSGCLAGHDIQNFIYHMKSQIQAEPALGKYTREMVIDAVVDDLWHGPKNATRAQVLEALRNQLDYADREGYDMPASYIGLDSWIDEVLNRLSISYVNK